MPALVVAHLAVAALLPLVSARTPRGAFAVAAALPAAALAWALAHAGAALGPGVTTSVEWAPQLGLQVAFRLDALALAMVVLVSGVGALVLAYCVGYFTPDSPEAPRTAALLLAFAGAMLGLVLADDLLTLYVFWELTSIASFLLVGQGGQERAERRAAVQALLVTVAGGLAMLLGFVLLGTLAGTYRISEIVEAGRAGALGGPLLAVALVLVLLGALTKSAILPFHPWLPAAMVAPTPVSAYLHAAAMVKAGVYLVARLSPGFADLALWWGPLVVLGLASMLVGGWRALVETDLKKLLALGTVSQLGFLLVLVGAGGEIAALAGVAMLLAHGLFKAPLFLTVGAIDHATGTRDLRELSGLRRTMPATAAVAALACASMAGLPPLLGFIGKEAAFEAFLHEGGVRGTTLALGLLAGSVLTTAYTARFLWGAFAAKSGVPATPVQRPGPALAGPIWPAALAGLALGLAYPVVDALARPYAAAVPGPSGGDYHLALWHGFGPPLLFSAVALGGGLALFAARLPWAGRLPARPDAQRGFEAAMRGVDRLALFVTGRTQVGSAPAYLGTILAAVVVLPGGAVVAAVAAGEGPGPPPAFDAVMQVPLAAVTIVAAAALLRARRRFTAVLLTGVIGYGVGGFFVVEGAPDLALAQFLVETLSLVAFVLVLRRLPARFGSARGGGSARSGRSVQVPKGLVAVAAGATVAAATLVLSAARTGPPSASGAYAELAPGEAGATNLVNAILVDFRALDTVGEISVLFVAAAGVASLVLATRHDRRGRSGQGSPQHEEDVLG